MADIMRPGKALVQPGNADEPYSSPAPTPARSEVTGRELDALVAEKVMGHLRPFARRPVGCPDGMVGCCVMHYDVFDAAGVRLPHYSTDFAAAWLIVEHVIHERRAHFKLDYNAGCGEKADMADVAWSASFWDDEIDAENYAATAPLAICRAALSLATAQPLAADEGR